MLENNSNTTNPRFCLFATLAAFSSQFAVATILSIVPASINEISRFYGASEAETGWLLGIVVLGFLVSVTIGGRYSDRFGKLPIMSVGCILMCAGMLAFALTRDFKLAFLFAFITGIGNGFAEAPAAATISDIYSGDRRTSMLNWSQAIFASGAVVSPILIAALLGSGISWRVGFFGAAGFSAIATIVNVATIAMHGERHAAANEDNAQWKDLLRDPLVLAFSTGIFLYLCAEGGQSNWLAPFFERNLHSGSALAASSGAYFWAGMGLGRITAARISKYVSDRALIKWSLGLAAISEVALLLTHSPIPALVAVVCLGFGMGPVWPTILSRAGAAYPNQSGAVFGIVVAAGGIGGTVFPPFIGELAEAIGLRLALWSCFAVLAANLLLFTRIRKIS